MLFMLYFIMDKNEKQHYCKSRDHTDHVYKNIKQVTRPALNKQLMYLITYAIQKAEQERDTAPDPYSQRVTRQERKGNPYLQRETRRKNKDYKCRNIPQL